MSTVQESAVLSKLRSRGFWRVVIRPTTFQHDRISDLDDLFPIVAKKSVQIRGWDYPHVDHNSPPRRGGAWVGQDCDWKGEIEVWRLYRSGQFLHYFAIAGDWRDESSFWPAPVDWKPRQELYYLDTIYSLVEIFEFATRLALSPAAAGWMRVDIELKDLAGRRLATTDSQIALHGDYQTHDAEWSHRWEGSAFDLIATPRELASTAARDLFARFGLEVSPMIMRMLQERIGR